MRRVLFLASFALIIAGTATAQHNTLTAQEEADGWKLLFNGEDLAGWTTSRERPPKTELVKDGMLNPRRCGAYLVITEEQYGDFILKFDFHLPPDANSGIFLRTFPLMPRKDSLMWENAIEVQLLDSPTDTEYDTGALYDLAPPTKNALQRGEWNHMEIYCNDNIIRVSVNGEQVNEIDLDAFIESGKRPDGTEHKFKAAFAEHPRKGYIGLQDHGDDVWFMNIKLLPLD